MADWRANLNLAGYSRSAALAAIRGERIPDELGHPLTRLCVVRGIRYHHGFGEELYDLLPVFARAINARRIMSGIVPEMSSPDEIPYCIWYPEAASEETYRALVHRYPQMAYQVGRACAVAGYSGLYHELDILPDVHIAEEARECGHAELYRSIMSHPSRFDIMDDYRRSIRSTEAQSAKPAYLNGDTCVRWMLDVKQAAGNADRGSIEADGTFYLDDMFFGVLGYKETTFNITEDMQVDELASDVDVGRLRPDRLEVQLLSEPLPADLPTVQKDLLITIAAFHGDVDRYVRLRRPVYVYGELHCCVQGIYRNTFFALWWSKQQRDRLSLITTAVNARMIMNNVLEGAPYPASDTPYLIWWPTLAKEDTYRRLARLQPSMCVQIVHACVFAGYRDLFDELLPQTTPNTALLEEASSQADPHYRDALQERVRALGINPDEGMATLNWTRYVRRNFGISSASMMKYLTNENGISMSFEMQHGGTLCDCSTVEHMASQHEARRVPSVRPSDQTSTPASP